MQRYFEINERGHNVRCKLYCHEPRGFAKAVVFCHGFGGHKDNSAAERFAQKLLAKYKGTAVVTFNWPSHGDDVKKKLTLADCDTYLELVTEYLHSHFGVETLYCYATSFGGYEVLRYIAAHGSPFRRIALRCPAVNMYEALTRRIMQGEDLEKLEKGRDVPVGFDRKVLIGPELLEQLREEDIRKLDFLDWAEDILILHGTKDEIIPYEESFAFADAQLMEFLPCEGADHRFRDPVKMELAIKHILEFLFA